jgi:hypothetical protein
MPGAVHPLDLAEERVGLDDLRRLLGQTADVCREVVGEVLVVVQEGREGERRDVVEPAAGGLLEQCVLAGADLGHAVGLGEDRGLGGCEDRVHAAQDEERGA